MEDEQIIDWFRKSKTKEKAFEALLEKYQEKVYWLVRKMLISHEDSADLTQEIFVKIWQNFSKFRGDSQLYTWIYRIATNECLSFLKKKKRKFFLSFQDLNTELSEKLDNEPYISGDEIQIKLQKALLTLPDKQRLVFNMKYFEEMKYSEISKVLGTSVGALKTSYHLAVKKIEAYLTEN